MYVAVPPACVLPAARSRYPPCCRRVWNSHGSGPVVPPAAINLKHSIEIRKLFTIFLWDQSMKCYTLRWRHNGGDSVSNHQPYDCLLNRLWRRKWKETSKLRVTGLCAGNSLGPSEFPTQMASNPENVSIWWRHHGLNEWQQSICNNILLLKGLIQKKRNSLVNALE